MKDILILQHFYPTDNHINAWGDYNTLLVECVRNPEKLEEPPVMQYFLRGNRGSKEITRAEYLQACEQLVFASSTKSDGWRDAMLNFAPLR